MDALAAQLAGLYRVRQENPSREDRGARARGLIPGEQGEFGAGDAHAVVAALDAEVPPRPQQPALSTLTSTRKA